ncbi:hypothetical protein [Bacillus sp. 7894-2]|uniref:hypothetical protein n=1 Tax=Bacillus sp. 7894-2 TaxID=2021695 RepID=UPI000BA56D85|nr:hypothetical protein [Bacillus sp. 7894-2]PAE25800.1 hypothetical protein CHI10_05830 [Bacillus sp. 7894-2]
MKVKIVLSIIALFFFALIIGLISLRNELDKPINTVILDRNGRTVVENSRWADKQELPDFMLDYFKVW